MAAGNYSIFKAAHISSFKIGGTAWTSANYASTTVALDTSFTTNNATPLANLIGARDSNNPVKSAAFIQDIKHSGNERTIIEEDLLGADSNSTQNKEVSASGASLLELEASLVYRNNIPMSLFNDSSKCILIEMDNSESSATGKINRAYNNVTIKKVGDEEMTPDGLMKQKIMITLKAGTTGSPLSVSTGSETWSRVTGGDYSEEVRTA